MITVYGRSDCLYCEMAVELLDKVGIDYQYKNVYDDSILEELLSKYPEAKTVPQIFWDNNHIGGYTELTAEIENLNLGNYGQGAF